MNALKTIKPAKADLKKALEKHEFVLYFQPQFNLANSIFEGVEALVRWHHPEAGLLLPEDFLPAIEDAGLVTELGELLLDQACRIGSEWCKKGLIPVRIAVNIHSDQFQKSDFVDTLLLILKKYDFDPNYLELELTENMIIQTDDVVTHENIRRLRARGMKIALDDFGTGYSSISHLKRIQVDRIKIDKSYIDQIHVNPGDAAIVRAIIALASGLKMRSLAEGVETHHQLQVLLTYDCHEAQGFYFSEPLTAKEAEEFLTLYTDNPFKFKHP